MSAFAEANPVERAIIDARNNGGGDSSVILSSPLLAALTQAPAAGVISQEKLFVILGRDTFSSGLWAAIDFKRLGAALAGEPFGHSPSHFGGVRTFVMPNSRIIVSCSACWRDLPGFPGPVLAPDIPPDLFLRLLQRVRPRTRRDPAPVPRGDRRIPFLIKHYFAGTTMNSQESPRRGFLKSAGAAALTTNIFTGRVSGANDRTVLGFIGMGQMGMGNLRYAMKTEKVQVAAVCDVYKPHLDAAVDTAKKGGFDAKGLKDFREILADKSIDAVCISTPDHWHALMAIEACKAGKDVYVEKPACVYVEEGLKMIQAARKYKRVVQGGTMQRSGGYFKKAAELVAAGELGDITFCHAWQAGLSRPEGFGNPPDEAPPADLDWEMWLGPAPKRPFNANRFGVAPKRWSTFRYFWDYAGGAMTDWGIHLLDPVHQALGDPMPKAIVCLGERFYIKDNLETPDTMLATFQYEKFLGSYESRTCNPAPMFGQGAGTSIHGTKGTLVLNRSGLWFTPVGQPGREPMVWEKNSEMSQMNVPHWLNFLECIRTREKPISDIENCVRSSVTCILANISLRFRSRLDWDEKNWTVAQSDVRQHLKANYRKPWKLEV